MTRTGVHQGCRPAWSPTGPPTPRLSAATTGSSAVGWTTGRRSSRPRVGHHQGSRGLAIGRALARAAAGGVGGLDVGLDGQVSGGAGRAALLVGDARRGATSARVGGRLARGRRADVVGAARRVVRVGGGGGGVGGVSPAAWPGRWPPAGTARPADPRGRASSPRPRSPSGSRRRSSRRHRCTAAASRRAALSPSPRTYITAVAICGVKPTNQDEETWSCRWWPYRSCRPPGARRLGVGAGAVQHHLLHRVADVGSRCRAAIASRGVRLVLVEHLAVAVGRPCR